MSPIQEQIMKHPFAEGLDSEFGMLISEHAKLESFRVEQPIFTEGYEADRVYLIQQGRVAIRTLVPGQGTTTVQTLGDGETIGWSWLFLSHHWHMSAVATEPTDVISLDAHRLRSEMEKNHSFGYAIAMRVGAVM